MNIIENIIMFCAVHVIFTFFIAILMEAIGCAVILYTPERFMAMPTIIATLFISAGIVLFMFLSVNNNLTSLNSFSHYSKAVSFEKYHEMSNEDSKTMYLLKGDKVYTLKHSDTYKFSKKMSVKTKKVVLQKRILNKNVTKLQRQYYNHVLKDYDRQITSANSNGRILIETPMK